MAVEVESRAHLVHFYENEVELNEVVGDYLRTAVSSGDVAVVVATEVHVRAFEAVLAEAGIDVEEARRDGRLVVLDASETLSRFMRDDGPDPAAFHEVLGDVVRRAAATGRRVRAYGEMVALLWDAGQVNAAIAVEGLWNALGDHLPFSLLCAYPTGSVAGEGHADALADVCRLHSAVLGPQRAEAARDFAGTAAAPGHARRFVVETLRMWGRPGLAEDAAVVVTELATNAVTHAGSPFVVVLVSSATGIRISVSDGNPVLPVLRDAGPADLSGRGLPLVAAVADRWGMEPADGGKAVWAELRETTPGG